MNGTSGSQSHGRDRVNRAVDKSLENFAPPGNFGKTSFGQSQGQGATWGDTWTPQFRPYLQGNNNTAATSHSNTHALTPVMAANHPTDAYDGDPAPPPGQSSGMMDVDMQHAELEQYDITQQDPLSINFGTHGRQNTTNNTQPVNIVNNPPSFNHLLAPAPPNVACTPIASNNASPQLGFNPTFQQHVQSSGTPHITPFGTPASTPLQLGNGSNQGQTADFKFAPPSRPASAMSQHQAAMLQYQTQLHQGVPQYQQMQYQQYPQMMQQQPTQQMGRYDGNRVPAPPPQYLVQQRQQTPTPLDRLQRPPANLAEEQLRARHQAERQALLIRQADQWDATSGYEINEERHLGYGPQPPVQPRHQQANNNIPEARNYYQTVQQHLQPQPGQMSSYPRLPSQPMVVKQIKSEGVDAARGSPNVPSLFPQRKIARQSLAPGTPNIATPSAPSQAQHVQSVHTPNRMLAYAPKPLNPPNVRNRITADLAAHRLVQNFVQRYQHDQLAINTFFRLASNFNNNIIDENQFYIDTYKLFYMLGSFDLLVHLYQQRPRTWFNSNIAWFHEFHRVIQRECEEEVLGAMSARVMRTGRGRRPVRGAEDTAPPSTPHQATGIPARGQQQTVETKIVNLKLSSNALQSIRQSGQPTTNAQPTGVDTAAYTAADLTADGAAEPWEDDDFLGEGPPTKKSKKKAPLKGYRAGQGDVNPGAGTGKVNRRKSLPTRLASTSKQVSSPQVATPAQDSGIDFDEGNDDEDDDQDDDDDDEDGQDGFDERPRKRANKKSRPVGPNIRAKRAISRDTSRLHGKDVAHVGRIYPTRRAILAREDKPYIHNACGQGFKHPDDVRKHHNQNCDSLKRPPGERKPLWDDHDSCQIRLSQLEYCKVEDGFVILDQASLDKVEACCNIGRASGTFTNGVWSAARFAKAKAIKKIDKEAENEGESELSSPPDSDEEMVADEEDLPVTQPVAKKAAAHGQDITTNPFTVNPLVANPFATNALITKPPPNSAPAPLSTPVNPKKKSTPAKTRTPKSKTPKKRVPAKRSSDGNGDEDSDHGSEKKKQVAKRQVVKAGPD